MSPGDLIEPWRSESSLVGSAYSTRRVARARQARCAMRNASSIAEELDDLRAWYAGFADREAAGRSPLYAELARGVANDEELLRMLCGLPAPKRQPNLLLAAVRHVCGLADGWPQFRAWYFAHHDEITAVMMARRTQTNEPARCATLLPLLAQLPQPLALVEVGAAAGLCLLVDYYGYDYGEGRTIPPVIPTPGAPVFACVANPLTPIPSKPVTVSWRAGVDLNPIEPSDPEQTRWLKTLIWPGEGRRSQMLDSALSIARRHPPRVTQADLRDGIAELASEAPRDATLVVFHTAVLNYLGTPQEREDFGDHVQSIGARWISNEGYGVLSPTTRETDQAWPANAFVLSLDRQPIAQTDPHGTWINWL